MSSLESLADGRTKPRTPTRRDPAGTVLAAYQTPDQRREARRERIRALELALGKPITLWPPT